MARLSLALLGPMQIALGGQPAGGFAYNKARALLAYLAVEAGRPHQRDTLAALLWPNMPDEAARHNLRQALANLRTVLGDAHATPPRMHVTRDTIQLNLGGGDSLDLSSFIALLKACKTHPHRHLGRCRSCAVRMEQAIALYGGEFLAGFSVGDSAPFEEWQLRIRQRLHQKALDTLARLADFHERRSDNSHARGYAQRQIEMEPWREEAHRQLIRLLAQSGQRSSALAQYEACRRVLARDLGVEPEAATTALYKQIRDGAPRTENREPGIDQTRHAHMPIAPTPLIGRESDLAELAALLENPSCRLVTIVGPGGIGKTRLALAAAAEQAEIFTDGAAFVPLQPIASAAFLAPAILSALNIQPQGQRDPQAYVLTYLRDKEMLLVLDNFEHLLAHEQSDSDDGTALLADILRCAPGVTFLVTSRERLALQDEWLFDLPSLSYPAGETINAIESYSAVQLFMRRASQVRRHFAPVEADLRAVVQICRAVEGLPLAIELAAAALRTHSCTAIADAIERSSMGLSSELRAMPQRHRSIRAAFEHSWRLLSGEEQEVFPRLSVFRGGFDQDAATEVARATPQILATLIDKSLLRWDAVKRYDLHELIRQYASEKLEQAAEVGRIRNQHAAYFVALAETAEPKLLSVARPYWLARLEQDHDNLRAALAWSQTAADAGDLGLRLAGALGWFWMHSDYLSEGQAWAEAALATTRISGQLRAQASALHSAGMLAWIQGKYALANNRLLESVRYWRQTDDRRGLAVTLSIAGMACAQSDYRVADDYCSESVALMREAGEPWVLAWVSYFFGNAAFHRSDYTTAASRYEECLALFRTLDDLWGLAAPLMRLGMIACTQGDYIRARVLLEESVAIRRKIKQKQMLAHSVAGLAEVALCQREYQEAVTHLTESLALYQDIGMLPSAVGMLKQFAQVAAVQEQFARAVRLYSAYNALTNQPGEEPNVAVLRAQLDAASFAVAKAEGQRMPLEQAIAYALELANLDAGIQSRAVVGLEQSH